ncbi:thiocyanate hydrolase [Prescottella subtropica]|uniref:thiocyanate hydrolase n=1 Tax=Prescottella subtropica TaxID=2545757 RepID=UPI0010F6C0E1|nr:thiocyanate hydrolase [Prescottella subtropica]
MADEQNVTGIRVPVLDRIVTRGQVWPRMAEKHGVTNPVPPWKSSLDATCDALDREATTLPPLTRRREEDALVEDVYRDLPFPENQLVALAHSLIARNVVDETELSQRLALVRARLEAAGD